MKDELAKGGLGITSSPLSCGGIAWGHSGAIPGYGTWAAATDDGRAASVTMTLEPKPVKPSSTWKRPWGLCR